MKSRTQGEDPAARAQRERERRLAELGGLETGMESADGLTEDLRKVYGLRRLGRPGAAATPGVQPAAAPMPIVEQAQRETAMDRQQQTAAMKSGGSSLAPATSPRPMPNPNYSSVSPLAPATSIRPMPNPNYSSSGSSGSNPLQQLWSSFVSSFSKPATTSKTQSVSVSKSGSSSSSSSSNKKK
jgi:hypothetical protein